VTKCLFHPDTELATGGCPVCNMQRGMIPQPMVPGSWNYGWLCPRCGRGNAPSTSTCPCSPLPPTQITC
jgi:hypothetical protein